MVGVDIRDLFDNESRVTPTYVLWLVEWLPEESAFVASRRGGQQHRAWTAEMHVAVTMMDVLKQANYQRGEGKGKAPKPTPRPAERTARRTVTVAELNARG